MDQLKPILEQCKKHLFWIVTGVAVLLGSLAFFLLQSNLNSAFQTQKKALDGHYTNIQQIRSAAATHPNEKSQEKMQEIIDSVAEEVKEAWQMQYDRQAKILVWPENIKKDNFALVSMLEKLHPIEMTTEYPTEISGITTSYKKIYARYFDNDMPRLAKIIGVNWQGEASEAAAGPMGGGSMGDDYGAGMGDDYGDGGYGMGDGGYGMGDGGYGMPGGAAANIPRDLVIWPEDSQSELLNSIRMWNSDAPSVYEILYTQENMWILEGLFNVIRKTNGDAKANFQCVIKEIEFIRIGRTAIGKAGEITSAASRGGGMYGGEEDFGAGGGYGADDYGTDGGGGDDYYGGEMSGGSFGDTPSRDPADRRYVDANFVAVTGEDLRTKMQSSSPEDAYFAVAKRVPVRMRMKIDQRKVHEFLAICGSADLMLEIRQVRLGDTTPAASSGSGGGMGGGYDYAAGMTGAAGGGTMDFGMGEAPASSTAKFDYDIDIEVYGIVYLFNPVDLERLGLNQVTEDTELDTTVEDTGAGDAGVPPVAPAGDPAQTPADEGAAQPDAGQQPPAVQPQGGQPDAGAPQQPPAQPGPGQPPAQPGPAGGAPATPAGTTAPAS